MSLLARSHRRFALVITLFTLLAPGRIFAVSCTTQAQMTEADRAALVQTANTLASAVQSGNVAAVQALTIPKVKAQFDSIANTIEQTAPLLAGATVTIDALYGLDASDLKSAVEDTQFFCGVRFAVACRDLDSQLPQGQYALTLVHATGVKQPQQMAFLLQKNGDWQLAGFFVKPLMVAGHDSLWYWTKARAYNQKGPEMERLLLLHHRRLPGDAGRFTDQRQPGEIEPGGGRFQARRPAGAQPMVSLPAVRPIPSATCTQMVLWAAWIW